jgi:hypothetical protein
MLDTFGNRICCSIGERLCGGYDLWKIVPYSLGLENLKYVTVLYFTACCNTLIPVMHTVYSFI